MFIYMHTRTLTRTHIHTHAHTRTHTRTHGHITHAHTCTHTHTHAHTHTCTHRATTHTDLIIRASEMGISYQVVHNASIMNAMLWATAVQFWRDSFYSILDWDVEAGELCWQNRVQFGTRTTYSMLTRCQVKRKKMIIRHYWKWEPILVPLQWEGPATPISTFSGFHSHRFSVHLMRLPLLIYACAFFLTCRYQG